MDNLTIYNINKKDANGQYYWSDKDVFKYNEGMKKDKKPKQVTWKCAYYDDGNECMEDRGLITMNNYNEHMIKFHC